MPNNYEIDFLTAYHYSPEPTVEPPTEVSQEAQKLREEIEERKKGSKVPVQSESFEKFAARTKQPVHVRPRKWLPRKTGVSKRQIRRARAILRQLDKKYGPVVPSTYPAAPRLAPDAAPGMYSGDLEHRAASGGTVFSARPGRLMR